MREVSHLQAGYVSFVMDQKTATGSLEKSPTLFALPHVDFLNQCPLPLFANKPKILL
jgi:hypothetical protein